MFLWYITCGFFISICSVHVVSPYSTVALQPQFHLRVVVQVPWGFHDTDKRRFRGFWICKKISHHGLVASPNALGTHAKIVTHTCFDSSDFFKNVPKKRAPTRGCRVRFTRTALFVRVDQPAPRRVRGCALRHLPLVGNMGEHAIERRLTVRGYAHNFRFVYVSWIALFHESERKVLLSDCFPCIACDSFAYIVVIVFVLHVQHESVGVAARQRAKVRVGIGLHTQRCFVSRKLIHVSLFVVPIQHGSRVVVGTKDSYSIHRRQTHGAITHFSVCDI